MITGFGRTGRPFGCETYGITPDTMSIAKALSSAYLPISAVLIPEFLYESLVEESGRIGAFGHGFTYSGHPVCAAVALENLAIMEELQLFDSVARIAPHFQGRLRALAAHPLVGEARGVGLLGGIELVADKVAKAPFDAQRGVAAYCVDACLAHGLILRNIGEVVAMSPPLIITDTQIDELFDKLERALADTLSWVRSA